MKAFVIIVGKEEKLIISILSFFLTIFFTIRRQKVLTSRSLKFLYQTTKFWSGPIWKHSQTTMWQEIEICIGKGRVYCGKKENLLFNPFPNKPWFLRVCSTSLLKTLWEKEKLLVMSNFSFSHSVFYPFGKLSAILINFEIVVCKFFQFGRLLTLSQTTHFGLFQIERVCRRQF